MFRKVLIWTLLVALVNSVVGCSHMVTISTEDAKRPKHELSITRVVLRPIIASLETSDRDPLQFDSAGGRFLPQQGVFVGRDLDGDSIRVGLASVREVQEYRHFPERNRMSPMKISQFLRVRHEFNVYGIRTDTVSPIGPRIELADSSGHFSLEGLRFMGHTVNGFDIDLPADDITSSWTKEKRTDYVKTTLLVTGTLIVVGAIAFVVGYNMHVSQNHGSTGW
jgi:hypothetical protein